MLVSDVDHRIRSRSEGVSAPAKYAGVPETLTHSAVSGLSEHHSSSLITGEKR